MGNRAFIMPKGANVGVYLHWNGGRDSVEAFLKYAELSGMPGLGKRSEYDTGLDGLPGFLTILVNFFGNDGMSVYLDTCNPHDLASVDPGDNGVYIVEGWDIVGRYWWGEDADEQRKYGLAEMLREIDKAQPERDRRVPSDKSTWNIYREDDDTVEATFNASTVDAVKLLEAYDANTYYVYRLEEVK